jgi:hypothetical protein
VIPIVFCERLVLEGSLKECKGDQGRVCDGSVTKELSNSKQVSKVVGRQMSDTVVFKVCKNGKLKVQSNKKIPADAPKQGGGKFR